MRSAYPTHQSYQVKLFTISPPMRRTIEQPARAVRLRFVLLFFAALAAAVIAF